MATTTYTVTRTDNGEVVATKSKKATAVAFADAFARENKVGVEVATGTGAVVHAVDGAKRKIKMSAPYTRVVALPAEVAEQINGKRVAYKRTRVGFALLDAGKGDYSIFDLVNGTEVGEIEVTTTREAGRWFADEAPALRASLEASNA